MNITANYTVDGSIIIGVTSISSYISGTTTNYEWVQDSASWTSMDYGETAYVTVSGRLKQYVVVNGVTKVYYYSYTRSSEFYS